MLSLCNLNELIQTISSLLGILGAVSSINSFISLNEVHIYSCLSECIEYSVLKSSVGNLSSKSSFIFSCSFYYLQPVITITSRSDSGHIVSLEGRCSVKVLEFANSIIVGVYSSTYVFIEGCNNLLFGNVNLSSLDEGGYSNLTILIKLCCITNSLQELTISSYSIVFLCQTSISKVVKQALKEPTFYHLTFGVLNMWTNHTTVCHINKLFLRTQLSILVLPLL